MPGEACCRRIIEARSRRQVRRGAGAGRGSAPQPRNGLWCHRHVNLKAAPGERRGAAAWQKRGLGAAAWQNAPPPSDEGHRLRRMRCGGAAWPGPGCHRRRARPGPRRASGVASARQWRHRGAAFRARQGAGGGGAVAGRDAYGCWVPLRCWMSRWLLFPAKMFFGGSAVMPLPGRRIASEQLQAFWALVSNCRLGIHGVFFAGI